MRIDTNLGLRAALVQAGGVIVLGLATGLALGHEFFEDWGWLVGPAAWIIATLVTARVLHLPRFKALVGAAIAGVVGLAATIAGVHWLGAALMIVLFALWCGRQFGRQAGPTQTRTA